MKFFTIITPTAVLRVRGKSVQQVSQACHTVGIKVQAIHMDREDD